MIDKSVAKRISQRLVRIREKLLFKFPFFGELSMNIMFGVASCGTAYTDMKRIVFDPEFADRLSDDELMFIMMHEIMHCALKHPRRSSGKLHMLYNIACDIVVNSNILECFGVPELMVDGEYVMHLSPSGREGRLMTAEMVYEELLSGKNMIKIMLSDGGYGEFSTDEIALTDDHLPWETLSGDDLLSDVWDKKVHKYGGNTFGNTLLPQSIRDIFEEERKNAKLRWKELLRDFLSMNTFSTDYTFTPPDRRLSYLDFFMPGENAIPEEDLQNIWFCIDTSGSISKEELTNLYTEVKDVVDQIPNASGLLSFFDTSVTEPVPFSTEADFSDIKPTGGGGTRFDIIFKYMEKNMDKHPNAIVILTDGYAPDVDEKLALGVPVLWILINNEETKPWGKTVNI